MSDSSGPTPAIPGVSHYVPHWIAIVLLILASVYLFHRLQNNPSPLSVSADSTAMGVDWFFMVQLPHVTKDPQSQNYAILLDERILALQKEGLRPMLLSDILERLDKGQTIPPHSVVFFYEQGYRTTVESAWPVLQKLQTPALLLTPTEPLKGGDWGYISKHRANTLRESGLWDVGYFEGSFPSRVELWSKRELPMRLGPDNGDPLWITDASESVLNRGPRPTRLRRLFFNPQWTTADVANRLKAEAPIDGPALLSLRPIQGRLWGVSLDPNESPTAVFDLRAAQNFRNAEVSWLGTRGLRNMELAAKADLIHGEWWFILRADQSGNNVRVGLLKDKIVIDAQIGDQIKLLSSTPHARPDSPFYRIRLKDQELRVFDATGATLATTRTPPFSQDTSNGLLRMMVYDRFHEAALAHGVELRITPLSEE